jgi:hypothetical protein
MPRLQPLHRIERDLQREVEQRRGADDGKARHDRQIEFETLGDDEDRRELSERGKPAQPQDGVQPDIALRVAQVGGGRKFRA